MSSNAIIGVDTRSGKRKRDIRDATAANAVEAFPGLPNHLVIAHILRSDYFDDPADLARLPSVSSAMCDTMAATGLRLKELGEYQASSLGFLSALRRLHRGGPLSREEHLCEAAARSGQLEELKLLHKNGWPWDERTCMLAARGGQLEILQWAHTNDCPWKSHTCDFAARGGHLEVLQWARANNCPWDAHTCACAARAGQLEVLQWAQANGCPWDESTCSCATIQGHVYILQWVRESGCSWDEETCELVDIYGHLETLNWLRANGCPEW